MSLPRLRQRFGFVNDDALSTINAIPLRLLPALLPSRWTAPDAGGQLWNIGPAHDR